ncbi:MAG: DNA topoisomerase IV subunit A [Spirochaetales bacterium]|nr:DNA topoisomerase IV subunit A [Spirochaetales bacterium]
MSYVKTLFNTNFLEYASYVIKDRAIPDIDDGFKPVQRRIIHSLLEMDDGKFHKVANVTGHCMKYHPHGDASIYAALVNLANKDMFIDKQGNFGNIYTGDEASAARYIECRILPLAKKVLYNPEITEFDDSYDGRNREPVVFPCKIPLVIIQGADGIAVGMSTKILPHNFNEVLEAVKSALRGKSFKLYPDFPTGGVIDVSDYEDGLGKVLVRAKIDESRDGKKIIIREIPYGTTTETLIASIENATKKGKLKIASINDYTTEKVEIEIHLARGVKTQDTLDALYAYTDCETSLSVNLLVIKDKKPCIMTVTEVINYHSGKIVEILTSELKVEQNNLRDKLHARTLERIFIEERIYKKIEQMKTKEGVISAVLKGFGPFLEEIKREVTVDDVERLLKIPIRRISLYDINKARQEIEEINERLKEIRHHLKNIVDYAVDFLSEIQKGQGELSVRKTEIVSFDKVEIRDVVARDLILRYDNEKGYLGYDVRTGSQMFSVSEFDKVLYIRNDGTYMVSKAPAKLYVDKGLWYCGLAEREIVSRVVFTILYREEKTKHIYIKRCKIEQFIMDRNYELVPPDSKVLKITTSVAGEILLKYKPKPRLKVLEESFLIPDFIVKGVKASGVRLTTKEVKLFSLKQPKNQTE